MSEKKDRGEPKRLTITAIDREIASGVNDKGGAWKLVALSVLDASGNPINVVGHDGKNATFKTFADVAPLVGKLEDYFVERQDHEKYGTSFLLTPKTSGLALKVESLTARVERLEQLVGGNGQPPPASDPSPALPPAGGGSPATNDDDIPF